MTGFASSANDVEVLEKTTAFQGYFRVDRYRLRHRLFAGGWSPPIVREVFERGHAVAVLPYDATRDQVVLIEQFRAGPFAAGDPPWLLEIVAGVIGPGETPEGVAVRELREEAGLTPTGALILIARCFSSPGGSSETFRLYCAPVDATSAGGIHGLAAESEDIRVVPMDFAAAWQALLDGRLNSPPPIIALQWLMLRRASIAQR